MDEHYKLPINSPVSFTYRSKILKALLIAFITLAIGSLKAQVTQTFTTNGTFIVPAGVTSLQVEAWGGGGAGGGGNGSTFGGTRSGGGGGGGAFTRNNTLGVFSGQVINYTIGAGGTGVNGGNGGNGSASVFSTVTAAGGFGGSAGNSGDATGNGGAGGVGGTFSGGNGATAVSASSGGGGGSAGSLGNGNAGGTPLGGIGGAGTSGNGATGVTTASIAGTNATFLGGGGGGARVNGNNDRAGGNGFQGQIIVTYIQATITSFTASACIGQTITINGTNFTGATAVLINGLNASYTVLNSTTITATIPAGASSGPIRVNVPTGFAISGSSITINPSPFVTPITGNTAVCAGSSTILSNATPGGSWSSSNPLVASVFNGTVTGLAAGSSVISYTVTNGFGCATTVSTTVNVYNQPTTITTQPTTSQTVCSGSNVSISVGATGSLLSYQWYNNGTPVANGGNISGANTNTLTFTSVLPSQSSPNYYVEVTGPCGQVFSNGSALTVNQIVNITSQPAASQILCVGGNATLTVIATGTGLTYQWFKGGGPLSDGGNISGATSPTLTISGLTLADAAPDYYVTVTGTAPCNPVTSSNAQLIINEPIIIVSQPQVQTIVCDGDPAGISILATGGNLSYQWYNGATPMVDGPNVFGSNTDTLYIMNATPADSSTDYHVVVSNACSPGLVSDMGELIVNVKPIIPNQTTTSCSGTMFIVDPQDGVPNPSVVVPFSTTYTWTAPVVTGGMTGASADVDQPFIGQTLINPTNTAQTATYTVTPRSGSSGNCIGNPFTVVVTVNPVPSIINMTPSVCSGDSFNITPSNGGGNIVPAGTTYTWPAPSVTGGITGGTSGTNQTSLNQILINPTNIPQTATYNVTATAGTCVGSTFTVTITVQPQPTVAGLPLTQTVCPGNLITPITMSNPNNVPGVTSYSWTRNNTAIVTGMANAGSGTITGSLNNSTNATQTVTFTLYANSEEGCVSAPTTVTIDVSPRPLPTAVPANQTVCPGAAITTVNFGTSNAVAGTIFTWVRDNTVNLTGIPASGSGSNLSGTLVNNTNTLQTTTFTLTADANGCINTTTFTINVRPRPTVAATPLTQTICGGSPISNIIISNPNAIAGTTFSWSRNNAVNVTGIGTTGTGPIISGTLHNNTGVDQTVTFTVMATAATCASVPMTVDVLVRPTPLVIATPASQNVCNNTAMTPIVISNTNNIPGTTYSWTRTNTVNITGIPDNDTTNNISGVLVNNTTSAQTTTITIIATAPNGCTRTNTATITVYPVLTAPVISETQTVCAGSTPTPLIVSVLPSGGTAIYSYQWQSSLSATGPFTNIAGATNSTYSPPATTGATPTTFYQLVANSCETMVSNVISVSVANNINFTFSTSGGGTTVCGGSAFNPYIESNQFLGDSNIRFTWAGNVNFISPVTGGPIGTTFTFTIFGIPIWSQSSATLPLTAINNTNANITTTVFITPNIYDDANNLVCSLSPRSVNVTIRPRPVATVTSPAAGTTICSATSAGITVSGNITSSSMTYSITRSANANVTSSATFPIASGTVGVGASYVINDILTNNSTVAQNVTYTITPSSTAGPCPGTPVTYTITVAPILTPGTIGADQAICVGGDPVPFTQLTPATGGGVLTYEWQSGPSATGPWTTIPGANGTTYDPPATIAADTWFIRVVTSTIGSLTCSVRNTTPVRVRINNVSPGSIGNAQTICSGGSPTAISNVVIGSSASGGAITFQWQSSTTGCSGPWTTIPTATATTYSPGPLTVTTYFKRITISTLLGTQCTADSNCIVMTVNDVTAGVVAADQVLCGNNPAAFTETTVATGSGTLSYQWQSNTTGCGGTWTNIPGPAATGATYDPPSGVTATTYYRRIVTSTLNGVQCTAIGNCLTVTANSVTGGVIDGNRTVCIGGDPVAFTELSPSSGTNITYQWQSSLTGGLGTWSDIPGATGLTYDVPGPVTQTMYYQRITISEVNSVLCTAASNFVTVFINDVTAETIAGDQTVCGLQDPVAFTVATPGSGLGTISYQWQSSTTGCSGPWTNVLGATAATYDPPILPVTTYYQVVTISTINSTTCTAVSNCVTVTTNSKTWNGSVSSDWDTAANWTPNGVPTSSHCVVIPNVTTDPILSGSANTGFAYNLAILSGGRLDVNPSNTLSVVNTVNVAGGGNLFITDTAALVQTDNVANTGTAVIRRITQPMYRFDFTYWGSPLVGGSYTLGNLSPNTLSDKYFSWIPTIAGGGGNWASESIATIMQAGKGYIVRAPQTFSPNPAITQTYSASFIGTPNNGNVNVPISIGTMPPASFNDKMNLLGNPYPSAVDADLFLNHPTNVGLLDGTIYFWTHHAPPSAAFANPFYGTFTYNYSPNGYASYNTLGATNTVPSGYGGPAPNGYIASGQGFFAKGLANGTAIFENSMRVGGNNNVFFRQSNAVEKHRVWLNFANTTGSFSQILVGYATDATNGIDRNYDGTTMSSGVNAIYSIADDSFLSIQGRQLPFDVDDIVPLGYTAGSVDTFTIGIDKVDGLFNEQKVYLEDKLLNVIHDLTLEAYTFIAEPGTFNDRFVLRYTDASLGIGNHQTTHAIAFVRDQTLFAQANGHIESILIYDLTGKHIHTYTPGQPGIFVGDFNFAQGIYISKIVLDSGETITGKLLH